MRTESTPRGVVVGVDGSPASRAATDWAARDAALRHLPLTVVHVQRRDDIGPWIDLPLCDEVVATERGWRAHEVVGDALALARDAAADAGAIEVDHRVVSGATVPTLVDLSKDAEMIVVGCRGLGGVPGLLLGSVSSGVVHHARCPVAVIHDEDPLMDYPAMARPHPSSRRRSPSKKPIAAGWNLSPCTPG
jgi:nucleotide-binding universal stress UspA family protein